MARQTKLMRSRFDGTDKKGEPYAKGDLIFWRPDGDKGQRVRYACSEALAEDAFERDTFERAKLEDLKGFMEILDPDVAVSRKRKHELVSLIMTYCTSPKETPEPEETTTPEETTPEETPEPEETTEESGNEIESAIRKIVERATPKLDEKRVREIVAESYNPTVVEIKKPDMPDTSKLGVQHKCFERLLRLVQMRKNIYLVGPTGSGKTRGAREVAKALELDFYSASMCNQTPEYKLTGHHGLDGYVKTDFRRAVEDGGVFLVDEIDNGNPNIIAVLNQINSADIGEEVPFPDGMVKKHADCVVIAAANTFGRGANREYVGRNQLDSASLNRFAMMVWDYDEALEKAVALAKGAKAEWVEKVQKIRAATNELKKRVIVSPRASIEGGPLVASGDFDDDEVLDMYVWQGTSDGVKTEIMSRAGV